MSVAIRYKLIKIWFYRQFVTSSWVIRNMENNMVFHQKKSGFVKNLDNYSVIQKFSVTLDSIC